MHYDVIIYVIVIDFLAIMSPGPDFFMVLKNSMTNSLKAGIYTTLGIALGSCIVFTIGILGIGAVVASSKFLFNVIKILGALYLTYLAIKSIFAKPHFHEPQLVHKHATFDLWKFFKVGLLCNITNPKAFMFIISLSTYVAIHGDTLQDGSVIIVVSSILTVAWFSLVSSVFGLASVRKVFYRNQRYINVFFGLVLLYVASRIIVL